MTARSVLQRLYAHGCLSTHKFTCKPFILYIKAGPRTSGIQRLWYRAFQRMGSANILPQISRYRSNGCKAVLVELSWRYVLLSPISTSRLIATSGRLQERPDAATGSDPRQIGLRLGDDGWAGSAAGTRLCTV